jgi:GAF domain-containing protein
MVSGNALGAFCVIDDQPHAWSYDEVRMLGDLAGCVMHEIELRTRLREADERVRQLEKVTH